MPSPPWQTWRRRRSAKLPRRLQTAIITSLNNPRVQRARRLHRRSARRREKAFLIEGPTVVGEALDSGMGIQEAFFDAEAPELDALRARCEAAGVAVALASENLIRAMADTVTHQGVVAVGTLPAMTFDRIGSPDLVLVLASVRDPGNAGTLLRSAVAAGAQAVVFSQDCVDAFSPKTVRASAGTIFRTPVVSEVAPEVWAEELGGSGLRLIGADAGAAIPMYEVDLAEPVALVIGNEAWGFPEEVRRLLDHVISIPMPGPVDSLNAGVAGSILLFEAVRQRRAGILESSSDE